MREERILIFGGSGLIGSRAIKLLSSNFKVVAPSHNEVDLTKPKRVLESIENINPAQILYASGFTNIDQAKEKVKDAFDLCCGAVAVITERAAKKRIPFHYLSTEIVFNGRQSKRPYNETDQTDPLSILASLKRLGELITLRESPENSIIRLVVCYSPVNHPKKDLARLALDKLKNGEAFKATTDQILNPTYADDLMGAVGEILKHRGCGIYHTGATDYTTPYEFIRKLARAFKLDENLVLPLSFEEFASTRPEPRPQHEWLDTKKFREDFGEGILHSVDEGIELFRENYQLFSRR
ncbi:MAG: sugar nucleotide-binding protein [bacterium]|nr:sugar nucleotide-binding protein [bacterium]